MRALLFVTPLMLAAAPVQAAELFGGIYAHDVDTPFSRSGQEAGADVHLGWRGERMKVLKAIGSPSPHLYVIGNLSGDTHFAVAGIDWKIGGRVYVRPGIGLAVHTGPGRSSSADRIRFGSRILFAPEVAVGVRAGERTSVELSWVHFSHAQLFGRQNPGTDSFGVRLNVRY